LKALILLFIVACNSKPSERTPAVEQIKKENMFKLIHYECIPLNCISVIRSDDYECVVSRKGGIWCERLI